VSSNFRDIPNSLRLLASYFGQDALYGDETVDHILGRIIHGHGADSLLEIQKYLGDCLKNDTLAELELKWDKSGSAIDFEEGTREFFEKVVNFDTRPFVNFKPRKHPSAWWKFW
jgi:hypothetical protein